MSGVCFLRHRHLHNRSWPVKLHKLRGRLVYEHGRDRSHDLYKVCSTELFHWDDKHCLHSVLTRLLHWNNVDGSYVLYSLRGGQI